LIIQVIEFCIADANFVKQKKKTSIKDEICGTLKKINDEGVNKLLEKLLEFKIQDKFVFQSPETVNSKDFHNHIQSEILCDQLWYA